MNVPDLVRNAATRFPDRPCVVEGERSLSFAAVDERADRLARAFVDQGLRPGDRVALLAKSEVEYFEIQFAAQRAGVILVPLNQRLAAAELRSILADCEPRLLIHGPDYEEVAAALEAPATWHLGAAGTGESYEAQLAEAEPGGGGIHDTLDADVPNTILYTSGTTGRAKGALTTNGTLWARVNMMALEIGMQPGDTFFFPIPLFHVSSGVAYAFAYRGATVVLMRDFDAARAVELMATHEVTQAVLVPTMLGRVVEAVDAGGVDFEALRLILYGGSAIAPDLLRRAMKALGCDFLQGYGLTEALNATMLRRHEHDPDGRPDLLASAGKDSISYETRLVNEDGEEIGPGEVGEILIRGPGVMDGYWNAPEATAQVLRDGWLRSGDLGLRTAEGYLFITDRLKDVIVTGGENVYSREVEDALCEHDGVLEAAVVGIPSPAWGEAVHGVVVARPGVTLDPDELIGHCRSLLAGYKCPKSIEIRDDLPKNASGKILKRDVREVYWRDSDRAIG